MSSLPPLLTKLHILQEEEKCYVNKQDINRVRLTLKDNKDMLWLTEEVKNYYEMEACGTLTSYLLIKSFIYRMLH